MAVGLETLNYFPCLLILPILWWVGHSLPAALGRRRAIAALILRTALVGLIVLALSGFQFGWLTDRVSVVYVLDQSDSIAEPAQRAMLEYAMESAQRDRDARRRDLVGMVAFAGESRIEVPPYDDRLPIDLRPASQELRADATNVEAAIDLAIASMPPDARRRIVLITDGNETTGNALRATAHAASQGIGIDVVPISYEEQADVSLDRLDVPDQINAGQPFSGRLIVSCHHTDPEAVIRGRISVTQSAHGQEQLVLNETVSLAPGKTVIPFQHRIQTPAAYSFAATFVPTRGAMDRQPKNNRVSAFAKVGGAARTLLIVPFDRADEYVSLAALLRDEKIEVDVRSVDAAFSSLADLLAYDSVILANVPKAGGDSAETMVGLSDAQIEMLVHNTQQFGAGLLMIGGPDALGAGGWGGTRLEAAMPVDFDIKNSKIRAVGALMLVIDASGSMSGEKLSLSRAAARGALLSLGQADYAGVITFDGQTRERIPLQRVGDPQRMLPAVSRISSGGGTVMFPAMSLGYTKLARVDAMVKHMIVLTDGRTQPGEFMELTLTMRRDGITVSTLAIGDDADVPLLRHIATRGGGKFYQLLSPQAIPRVVLRESRRVAKPLIFEREEGIYPQRAFPHVVVDGIADIPPVTGLVLTTPKDSPLVNNVLMSPQPEDLDHPILSVWTYGLGHAAVLTTDAGQRWTQAWLPWPGRGKLFGQLVRWLKRPSGVSDSFRVTSQWSDGEIQVIVNTVDPETGVSDLMEMQAAAIGPELDSAKLELRKVAPGRFVGAFAVETPGSYFLRVQPGPAQAPLITGVTVPFGEEYRAHQNNGGLLESLAGTRPSGGETGELARPLAGSAANAVAINHFRKGLPSQASLKDAWPWLVLISCVLFLGDVGNRRLALDFSWILRWWSPRPPVNAGEAAQLDRLQNLKQAKAASTTAISPHSTLQAPFKTRSASCENVPSAADGSDAQQSPETQIPAVPARDQAASVDTAQAEPTYVERLLEAKRQAQTGNR